ncbi:hypothetical protein PLICRDRAFT_99517 [Plicaturopsis crispa FD-325 SS-3]|nr:hypothetical protein PLICRDRAFT_99517 [Plicaturopsis crispa FD-325 SS-3]
MAREFNGIRNQAYDPGSEDEGESEDPGRHIEASDDESDTAGLIELRRPEDFVTHFEERDGRLFHSHGIGLPYPLPVDGSEQRRLDVQHDVICQVIGANYIGPVREVLAPIPGRQRLAVDLCTGTGKWVLEMAREFDHVRFRGLDIVPIASQYPPTNARFELHDCNQPLRWRSGHVDLVHACGVSLAIRDYPRLVDEVARILRAGGLFLSYEWGRFLAFHPDLHLATDIPQEIHRFYDAIDEALRLTRGLGRVAGVVPDWLHQSGLFRDVTAQCYYVPVGDWMPNLEQREIGIAYRDMLVGYAEAVRPLLRQAEWPEDGVNELVEGFLRGMRETDGMVSILYTVHARRI